VAAVTLEGEVAVAAAAPPPPAAIKYSCVSSATTKLAPPPPQALGPPDAPPPPKTAGAAEDDELPDPLAPTPMNKKEPLKVILATNNYKKKNDIFKQFVDEYVEEKEGKIITHLEMYSMFKDWQKESCPNNPCPDRSEFMDYFIELGGNCEKGVWKNKYLRGPIDNA
jgi:hypothetical protein